MITTYLYKYFYLKPENNKTKSPLKTNLVQNTIDSSSKETLESKKDYTLSDTIFLQTNQLFQTCFKIISLFPLSIERFCLNPKETLWRRILKNTANFKNYAIQIDDPKIIHWLRGFPLTLTGVSLRPANFFFKSLGIDTTLPESQKLFAHKDLASSKKKIYKLDNNQIIEFCASKQKVKIKKEQSTDFLEVDASNVFGNNTYRMSGLEIKKILESQRIYLSPELPKAFYMGLKKAMIEDKMILLPGNDAHPTLLKELFIKKGKVASYLHAVKKNPINFGFSTSEAFEKMCDLTIYEIGCMVVKSEAFYIFVDEHGKILERSPNTSDDIRLISACGIRGFHATKTHDLTSLAKETFKTALLAAGSGFVLFPAVGMGVWGGSPQVYWTAFFTAVLESDSSFEKIFINPGHQPTHKSLRDGNFKGKWNGDEFQYFLKTFTSQHKGDPRLTKLSKIYDLSSPGSTGKDLVQLSLQLKKTFPDKIVSLFNASDPDVTLGNHVGEYVNEWPHGNTTEENFTALGTNGLCFEEITGIHTDPKRIIQRPF